MLAWEFGLSLRPDKASTGFPELHDALQLDVLCNHTAAVARNDSNLLAQTKRAVAARLKRWQKQQDEENQAQSEQGVHRQQWLAEYYVSTSGDDGAAGTLTAPFETPQRGVLACRSRRETAAADNIFNNDSDGAVCTVYLRGGVYSIKPEQPLTITPADSYLTIQSYTGELAELSGAVPLQGLEWTRAPAADVTGQQQRQRQPGSGGTEGEGDKPGVGGGAGFAGVANNPNVAIWVTKVNLTHIAALRVQGKIAPKARYPNVVDVESLGSKGPLEGTLLSHRHFVYSRGALACLACPSRNG